MNKIKKYCDKQQKILLKILKKMFGYTDFVSAIEEESRIQLALEKEFKKEIDLLSWSEIKTSKTAPKSYAKYKTLKVLLDTYFNIKKIYTFSNDCEELM